MLYGFNTLSLYKNGVDPALYMDVAVAADELGFDSMWMGHHLIFPTEISATYPYSKDGVSPHSPDMDRIDPWVLFAHLAARTTRLRFATGVYLLPLVNPIVTAWAVTTADILSNGRVIFGVGVGWNREEYDIVGEDFTNRGRRADEIIEILRRFWSEKTIEFDGEHYGFGPVYFEPKPSQPLGPPMIYGGASPAALRRAAGLDGCYLPVADVELAKGALAEIYRIRNAAEVPAGTVRRDFEVTAAVPQPLSDANIEKFEAAGIHRVLFEIGDSPLDEQPVELTGKALIGNLERVARHVGLT